MKIRIIDDTLADQEVGHDIPIGAVVEGWREDDGHMHTPVVDGCIVILESEYEIIEETE